MTNRTITLIDIPAKDRQATAKFYNEMFGWEHQDYPESNYSTSSAGNVALGYLQSTPERPGVVAFYVHSPDVDADLKKAEQLGGSVVVPRVDIPNMGSYAFFKDLDGNIIGLTSW